jgi:Tfp pilus assembly PilM family ATPase
VTSKGLHIAGGAGVIGVDVGDRWMIASQLVSRGGARAAMGASVRLPRTATGALTSQEAMLLGQTIAHAGFTGSRIALVAPDAALLPAVLELPPRTSKAPIEQLARIEVARIHRREPDGFDLATWDLPATDRTRGVTHAMALALPTEAGDVAATAFDVTGADVVAIEPRACALARCGAAASGGVPGLYGVVDVGWSATTLVLVHVTGDTPASVVYERRMQEVQLGGCIERLRQAIGVDTDVAEAAMRRSEEEMREAKLAELYRTIRRFQTELSDALVPEVQRSFVYAMQRYPAIPMAGVWLTGEGACVRGVRARLSSALALDVALMTPATVTQVDERSPLARDAMLMTSLGLAAFAEAGARQERRAA